MFGRSDSYATAAFLVLAMAIACNESVLGSGSGEHDPGTPDTTPPSVPQELTATPIGTDSIALTWDRPTDDRGIYSYEVFRDGTRISVLGATSTYLMNFLVLQGLATDQDHTYLVRACDTAGNCSDSAPITARPLATPRGKADIYVDRRLPHDLPDGSYDKGGRTGGGSDGNAYRTIQAALATMNPGDTVLMRGDTYHESDITVPLDNPPQSWTDAKTLSSYPGEWAVIDGQHLEGVNQDGSIRTYSVLRSSGSGERHLKFWRFRWFEVTGGGPGLQNEDGTPRSYDDIGSLSGKGFDFWPARDVEFDHLYVHGNYGGGGPNGGAGISIQNENGGAQRIRITSCRLRDNGWPGSNNGNLANIIFYADYAWRDFPDIDTSKGASLNEVDHNLLEDSAICFKHKGTQFLSLDHQGTHMDNQALGDRFHHNVARGCHIGFLVNQDFAQVHNNVVIGGSFGISVGQPPSTGYRELFHVVAYNNTIVGANADLVVFKGFEDDAYNYLDLPYHPFFHALNNIFDWTSTSVDAEHAPLALLPTYTREIELDFDTIDLRNNLFHGRGASDEAIRVGTQDLSAAAAASGSWGESLYASTTTPLFQGTVGAAAVKARGSFALQPVEGGTPTDISAGGTGGTHPYLAEALPSYVGAVDPAGGDWVDDVFALEGLGTTLRTPTF
jgi:hypothetical protein